MQVRWIPGEGYWANAYICGEVLIDAGVTPMQVEAYAPDITTIVLTHCHYDHIAHAHHIAYMCDAKVFIHEADEPALTHGRSEVTLSAMFGERTPAVPLAGTLEDGDTIGGLKVIHTPGHTPGSICLWDQEDENLISGDTVFADGGVGRTDFPGGSQEELVHSLDRLAGYDVQAIWPGHGMPAKENGFRHIEAARRMIGYY
ncbi:MBL fold metallo-hydrolase [Methanogenium marinum]|uniref:MBL fold metallo-hydrolase n=1 Tax=Methanogenium marinum TaxID=348610 RepID=A0A9Q4PVX2_9EURY|nr:MBL fold metallo-hydrolase [Methanogenium marinum]MDE4908470.1 MBL fold metallo-hydrolase [Methanogenium marinum]